MRTTFYPRLQSSSKTAVNAVVFLSLVWMFPVSAMAQITDRARTVFDQGTLALQAGRLPEAENAFREAARLLDLAPGDAHYAELAAALNNLGVTLANRNESVRAIPVLRRALALIDPKNAGVARIAGNLARIHIDLGELGSAAPLVDQALRTAEEHDSAYQAYALALRARLRQQRHDCKGAISDARRALLFAAPDDLALRVTVLHLRGLSHFNCTPVDPSAAKGDLQEAVRLAALLPSGTLGLDLAALRRDYVLIVRRSSHGKITKP